MPQEMADHPVGGGGSLSSCYLVRRPEVDALGGREIRPKFAPKFACNRRRPWL